MTAHDDFLHFFQPCAADLRACIGAIVRDPHRRDDIFQEVSRILWQKFDEFRAGESFGAWARGIAVRKIMEARRSDGRFPALLPAPALEAILEAFDDTPPSAADEEAALADCLRSLPEKSRQILQWHYEGGLRCKVIAQRTGSTLKAIHQTLCRLRQSLADCISRRLAAENFEPVRQREIETEPV